MLSSAREKLADRSTAAWLLGALCTAALLLWQLTRDNWFGCFLRSLCRYVMLLPFLNLFFYVDGYLANVLKAWPISLKSCTKLFVLIAAIIYGMTAKRV
mmetsp:Transcript_73904/g.171436  ORF Transcript_73904/g.171436 Transcript_73904/m.171436 type:complete len:99 (+) Transcript_73904:41-337(+)